MTEYTELRRLATEANVTTSHVGATQEIWDAINVDLQQILDDVSCWEGRHAERMCERLETAIKRLNAAVGNEREGYETAIAVGYENDALRTRLVEVEKDAEIARMERDHARTHYDNAVRILTGIHALLYPPRFTDHDGRTWQFKSPIAEEQMQELSDRIRALPDEIAAIDAAMKEQA